jgi:hypothetical protein
MARDRRTYSLDPSSATLLEQLGNASEYLSRVVQQRWSAWIDALDLLRVEGWTRPEIFAAIDALNGTWLVGAAARSSQGIAPELLDFAALHGGAAKWEVTDTWSDRVRAVAGSREIADAVVTIACESWAGNTVLDQAIERIGRPTE